MRSTDGLEELTKFLQSRAEISRDVKFHLVDDLGFLYRPRSEVKHQVPTGSIRNSGVDQYYVDAKNLPVGGPGLTPSDALMLLNYIARHYKRIEKVWLPSNFDIINYEDLRHIYEQLEKPREAKQQLEELHKKLWCELMVLKPGDLIETREKETIAVEIRMVDRTPVIWVAGGEKIRIRKPLRRDGAPFNFLKYILLHPETLIARGIVQTEVEGCRTKNDLTELVRQCGFDTELKKAFFPACETKAVKITPSIVVSKDEVNKYRSKFKVVNY